MEQTSKYLVVISTDPYHASRRDGYKLNGSRTRAYKVIGEYDTLRKANEHLLNLFCDDIGRLCPNWGVATRITRPGIWAYPTNTDGTRVYNYDTDKVETISSEEHERTMNR